MKTQLLHEKYLRVNTRILNTTRKPRQTTNTSLALSRNPFEYLNIDDSHIHPVPGRQSK